MGASTGVGALIVGVAMLSVFVLANSALDAQIESGIERMEKSREQVSPSFSIDDASNDVDAIDALDIDSAGSGYSTHICAFQPSAKGEITVPTAAFAKRWQWHADEWHIYGS